MAEQTMDLGFDTLPFCVYQTSQYAFMCGMLNIVIGSLFWPYHIHVSLIIARDFLSTKCK